MIIAFLIWHIVIMLVLYIILNKKKSLFDDRFANTVAIVASFTFSFQLTLLLVLLYSRPFVVVLMGSWLVATIVAYGFGSFVRSDHIIHSQFLTLQGVISGAMLGAVLKNPALCQLPLSSNTWFISIDGLAGFMALTVTLFYLLLLYAFSV
ncbi:hypothetical protein H0266_14365 [Halobacillus locisalis]|uniref:Uncharacterized protein n=1 Tax=Halobacillus locisalis TaxID=220753 RepID=A0A838CVI9_9BACI|nr:hypothetical protein [Halobacillus locisalis]MBA2176077.1 hypothetical protein [Halobacillus locisalis]